MKIPFSVIACAFALSCGSANALQIEAIQTNPGLTTNTGLCTISFDGSSPFGGCGNGYTYTATDGAGNHVVTGTLAFQYVQPANDASPYLTVGGSTLPAPIVITLTTGANYFGFYAGSIDSYNTVTFSDGTSPNLVLTGDQIDSYVNGADAGYFNVFTDSPFTSITLSSDRAAFETDNHAFGIASPVPEPETVALFGMGVLALVAGRRRRGRK